jgi:hypothetical protein
MMLVVHQWSAKVDLGGPPEFCSSVLRRSAGGIGNKMADHQWSATGQSLMVHRWTTSGQPLWFNTIGPPADQQWHLLPTADRRKTDEQISGRPLVAAAGGRPRVYLLGTDLWEA